MKIGCVCPTYKRPHLLGRAIHCFLTQTHSDCYLVVLDDAGQYQSQEHDKWKLVSTSKRFNSLGGKRQAGIDLLPDDCEGYLCWDDDDVYFPDAVANASKALQNAAWAQCRIVWETLNSNTLTATEAFSRRNQPRHTHPTWGYGGCWAYRLAEHQQLGGYPDDPTWSSCDDTELANRFYSRFGCSANSSPDMPWYWYNRDNGVNKVSDEGVGFWTTRAKLPSSPVAELQIGWNGPDFTRKNTITFPTRPLGWQQN